MKPLNSTQNSEEWPRKEKVGRVEVTIYRRKTPKGNFAYMVANYAEGKRRFDSYATEAEAIEEAKKLAKRLSQMDVMSASITKEQAIEYASSAQALQPLGISLTAAVSAVIEAVKLAGDLPNVIAAAKFYSTRHKQVTAKRVAEVVDELIKIKESRGAAERYAADLRGRLKQFVQVFQKDIGSITTAEIQDWLDSRKLSTQSYKNNRTVLNLLFGFAVTRGYAVDNPVEKVEHIKVKNGATEIFTPSEISQLLSASSPDFLPALVLGAFAGLRSAEIERLEWSDIDFAEGQIVMAKSKTKTRARRTIPIQPNLAEWLAPYKGYAGKVWGGAWLYRAQEDATKMAGIKWKKNGLRHSYASYRLAQTKNAAQVSDECGNSPQMIYRHYHELVKPSEAARWFEIKPAEQTNVIPMGAANG